MDKVCTAHVRCSHRVWIDDMSQSTKGTQQQVKRDLVSCVIDTARGLQQQGLKLAGKSVIVCSKFSDAKEIVRALRLRGVLVAAARHTSYLGIDLGGRRRHVRDERRER
eukprot:6521958-Pyramimonas_sp.AAC.1